MNARDRRISGFTIMEALVALTIGGFVLATVATLLVQSFLVWRSQAGQWHLAQSGRVARERILRGTFGMHGVRSATTNMAFNTGWSTMKSLTYETLDNDFFEVYMYDGSILYLLELPSTTPWWDGGYLKFRYGIDPNVRVAYVTNMYLSADRMLNMEFGLQFRTGGQTYTNRQRIRTYVLND